MSVQMSVLLVIIIEEAMDAFSRPLLAACPVELLIDSEVPMMMIVYLTRNRENKNSKGNEQNTLPATKTRKHNGPKKRLRN